MDKSIEIKNITAANAKELSDLLCSEESGYSKYFIPFDFDHHSIHSLLKKSIADKYFGIFIDSRLAGFYMLRGIDEGFSVPAYGVFISKKYTGLGLAKLTLYHAYSVCKTNNIKEMMLKVHPENTYAKKMYEDFGFKLSGKDAKNDNFLYKIKIEKKLDS